MTCEKCRFYRNSRDLDFVVTRKKAGRQRLRKWSPVAKLETNLRANDQLPVSEMGDRRDSIADASRDLVFQAGPIQHLLLENAERSLVIHPAVVEYHVGHLHCADALLRTSLEGPGCHFAASHVPDQKLCHDGS